MLDKGWSGCNNYTENIERVLAADRETETNATSINHVLSRMRSIDLKGCPTDFADGRMPLSLARAIQSSRKAKRIAADGVAGTDMA